MSEQKPQETPEVSPSGAPGTEPERRRERRGDRRSGIMGGLVLVLLGVLLFLMSKGWLSRNDWGGYFMVGLGAIFIGEASLRREAPAMGRIITGGIIFVVGIGFILGSPDWWALVLIAIGAGLLARYSR